MNKFIVAVLFMIQLKCFAVEVDKIVDLNDVEHNACQYGCESEHFRETDYEETYDTLYKCSECSKLFDLCIKYRTCQEGCVPEMAVLPYTQARDLARRVRPPINPCLDLVSACNYESMDSYEIMRTENPFLYV